MKPNYYKEYYQKNKDILAPRYKAQARAKRLIVLQFYGGNPPKCACCGEIIYEFLTIDHMNNDGAKHRREIGTDGNRGGRIYNWLIRNKFPKGFQVLCWNCNCAKGLYGECPHNLKK